MGYLLGGFCFKCIWSKGRGFCLLERNDWDRQKGAAVVMSRRISYDVCTTARKGVCNE